MQSPESFAQPVAPELPPPTREQLRNSLIVDPYHTIQQAVEDQYEQTRAAFEEAVAGIDPANNYILDMYRKQLADNFATMIGELSAECELRLHDFDGKPETVTSEQLEQWFSGVTMKAAQLREEYMTKGKREKEVILMALGQFRTPLRTSEAQESLDTADKDPDRQETTPPEPPHV